MISALRMYTIYHNALDYPGVFVVRRCLIQSGGVAHDQALIGAPQKTLDAARALIPAGLVRMPRSEHDEVQIVETWI